jgi:hypothetical protein
MKWNHETQSYRSEGKMGIGNIRGTQINKLVDGKLEIIKKRSGDIMNLLIKMDDTHWYMFSYSRGLMQVLSSNEAYNTIIYNTKAKDRKANDATIQAPYQYVLATDDKFKRTVNRLLSGKEIEEEETPDQNENPQQNKEENNGENQ